MGRYTPEQTYKIMSGIHSKDTDIEVILRKALWHKGYRYRKNVTSLIGKPDIVFTKHKLAIFCDSEFWHGKDWDILRERKCRMRNHSVFFLYAPHIYRKQDFLKVMIKARV